MSLAEAAKLMGSQSRVRHLVRRIQSRTRLTQEEIGRRLGYTGPAFRRFLAPPEAATHRPTPHLLHLALERWARELPPGDGGDSR